MNRIMIGIAVTAVAAGVVHGQEQKIEPKIAASFIKTPLESRTGKGAPYSAEFVNDFVQTLADGNRIVHHSTGRVYRDSEGRVRPEEDRPSGSPAISITDPVAGSAYSLNPETHIAMKTPSFAGTVIMNKMDMLKTTVEAQLAGGRVETRTVEPGTVVLPDGPGLTTVEFNGSPFTVRRSGDGERRNQKTLQSKGIESMLAEGPRKTTTIAAGVGGNERPT